MLGTDMSKFLFLFSFILLFSFIYTGCKKTSEEPKGSAAYINQIIQWHTRRVQNLEKENGWLNLIGLYWLKEGENKIGSAKNNDIIFPEGKSPEHIGSLFLKDSVVTIKVNRGINITSGGKQVTGLKLADDNSDNPTVLATGSLRFFIVKRGTRFGVRLRDLDAPLLKEFKGTQMFPINEDWKVTAQFKRYDKPDVISIPTIIGTPEQDTIPGSLSFSINGNPYELLPVKDGNQLFIIFADETNGNETYGAGRFLYTDFPDSTGKVILDFNKAYNPPCSFTPFATCPLPPKQNYLHLKITAGELKYSGSHE
jgi:uncharacterized protein